VKKSHIVLTAIGVVAAGAFIIAALLPDAELGSPGRRPGGADMFGAVL